MSKRFLIGATLFIITIQLKAQGHFGAYVQTTQSTLTVKTNDHPDLGRYRFNYKSGIGGGIIYEIDLSNLISLSHRLNYSQKGYAAHKRTKEGGFSKEVVSYTSHNVRLDELIKVWFKENRTNTAYVIGGLRNELLVHHDLPEEIIQPQIGEFLKTSDFRQWDFGGVLGAGLKNYNTFIEGGLDLDLAPSLETDHTKIHGITWFANIGIII